MKWKRLIEKESQINGKFWPDPESLDGDETKEKDGEFWRFVQHKKVRKERREKEKTSNDITAKDGS